MDYYPIKNYGIIGDCHTAALISRDGTIDFYCPGRFDSGTVFCRLLDSKKGGSLSLQPVNGYEVQRAYLKKTNILENFFKAGQSEVRISYFMPIRGQGTLHKGYDVKTSRRILIKVKGEKGESKLHLEFDPAFHYATQATQTEIFPGLGVLASGERQFLSLLCSNLKLDFGLSEKRGLKADLHLKEGEEGWLVLNDSDSREEALKNHEPQFYDHELEETIAYWRRWVDDCSYNGPYRNEVVRSALTLKLLIFEPKGSFVAAATTSLPEQVGGSRNWDYRFTWLRDSTLSLASLIAVGYEHEAADFFEWLQDTHQNDRNRDLQILYCIDGQRDLTEKILEHLEGYRNSRPVRLGNGAAGQLQLDIYGEILNAAHLYYRLGIGKGGALESGSEDPHRSLERYWPLLSHLVEKAANRWMEPDNGIWEVRGGLRHYLYSKMMCWVALDRGIKLAKEFSLKAPLVEWSRKRDSIQNAILERGYNRKIEAFVQSFDSEALDASVLILPRLGILPPTDPRVQSTLSKIRSSLTSNGLVYRYLTPDGISGKEETFALCTFWLVDCLALSGRLEEAHDLFEHVLKYSNDLSLFSEEINPGTGELLGNFPQAFTHMALINSAVYLAKAAKHGAESEIETEYERIIKGKAAAKEGFSARKK